MIEIVAVTVIGIVLATLLFFVRLRRKNQRNRKLLTGTKEGETLPHTHEWELYHNEQAPSRRIRVCLAELHVAYKSHEVRIQADINNSISKNLMAAVTKFQVPLLLHNGRALYNSQRQISYLVAQHERGARLLRATAEENTRLEYWLNKLSARDENDFSLAGSASGNELFTIALPVMGAILEQIEAKLLVKIFIFNPFFRKPLGATALRALTTLSILENPVLTEAFETAKEIIEDQLDEAERSLKTHGGPWIIGTTFSQIDIEMMVLLYRLKEVTMLDDLLRSRRPNLAIYWDQLVLRPSYKIALVDHPRPAIEAATEKILATRATNPEFDELFRVNH
ncbi:glutathione S-transferase [Pseudomonadales bacterium]|nr:glutathione S-transferase [Pseudomonadales bacterium]MDA9256584.1 glutathione S-transferase [Pseudomonadales bacterium]MDB2595080.1 glutathione S-transferase [Pseudomonadales bacterium]